ncbi:MAG: nucleotidyltransferase family protein [Chloroflexi bacterium]|nr:nucleotidyltransferase family protein [Chloroflexota bacterium]
MSASAFVTSSLLLQALQPPQTSESWFAAAHQADIAWDDLAVRAIAFGLAPQLHHRLQQWGLTLPGHAAAKLLVTHRAQEKRYQAINAQLGELLSACATCDLHPIVLKGAHLAALVYPAPGLRPMNDIDILFPPAELAAAEALLSDLAYGGKHKSAEMGAGVSKHTSTFRREGEQGATPNPYLSADSGRMVEPHSSLEESWFGLKVDITPGVRQRAIPVTLAGQPAHVLAPDDLLLHICVHFCFHLIQGAPAMVQLTDVLAITQAGGIHWPTFCQRATEKRAAPYALASLLLGQKLLAAPVPPDVLEPLRRATPRLLRQRIENLGLADVLKRTQQKPLITLGQRLRRGWQDRAETARWAQDWRGRVAVWRTALNVGKTDTGQLLQRKLQVSSKQ